MGAKRKAPYRRLQHWLAPSRAEKGQELHSQAHCSMGGKGSQEADL